MSHLRIADYFHIENIVVCFLGRYGIESWESISDLAPCICRPFGSNELWKEFTKKKKKHKTELKSRRTQVYFQETTKTARFICSLFSTNVMQVNFNCQVDWQTHVWERQSICEIHIASAGQGSKHIWSVSSFNIYIFSRKQGKVLMVFVSCNSTENYHNIWSKNSKTEIWKRFWQIFT